MLEKPAPSDSSVVCVLFSHSLFPCLSPSISPYSLSLWCVSSAVPTPPVIMFFLQVSLPSPLSLFSIIHGVWGLYGCLSWQTAFPFSQASYGSASSRHVAHKSGQNESSDRYGGVYSSLMLIVREGGPVKRTLGCDSRHWSPNSSLTRGTTWSQSPHPTTSRLVASLPSGMSLAF